MSSREYHLRLLGGPAINAEHDAPAPLAVWRHPLALAAILAADTRGTVTRDKLMALLWPEADTERARKRLRVALHALRQALGQDAIVSVADGLRLDATRVRCDVADFCSALEAGPPELAVQAYGGPFLDGFHLPDSLEFDEWAEAQRDRLARLYRAALEQLAEASAAAGELSVAVEWWRKRAVEEPGNGRVAMSLMEALERAGNAAGALREAERHARVLRDEFDAEPTAEVRTLVERIRTGAGSGASHPGVEGGLRRPVDSSSDNDSRLAIADVLPGPASPTVVGSRHSDAGSKGTRIGRRKRAAVIALATATALGLGAIVWLGTRTSSASPGSSQSILVLPFDDLTGSSGDAYFVEGMYNAVINELAQIRALRLVPRTSATHYDAAGRSVSEIAHHFDVDAIVEGAVSRSGGRVRIDVELVTVRPERHLWARSYERDLRDVLRLHADIARNIAAEIHVSLTPLEAERLASAPATHPAAYDAWLRGSYHASRRSGTHAKECLRWGREAAAIEPGYAEAHALLAVCYNVMTFVTPSAPHEMFDSAKVAARRALDFDGTLAAAHAAYAYAVAHNDWDWEGAEQAYRLALRFDPGLVVAHGDLAWLLAWIGRTEEALEHARRAERLDPVSPQAALRVGMILHLARRYDEALAQARRAIELDPDFMFAYDRLHWAYDGLGRYHEAVTAAERAAELSGATDMRRRAFLAHAYGFAGRRAEARVVLDELLSSARTAYVPPTAIAAAHVGLGDNTEAIRWLERGLDGRDGDMVLLKTFSLWDPLRDDPRFGALMERMNYPERGSVDRSAAAAARPST